MFCQKCGTQNPETALFCSNCGNAINGTLPKRKNKFVWIGGLILVAILLFCVAPITYAYIKIKSIPTSTPYPTLTPIPTQDSAGSAYAKNQLELVTKEKGDFDAIQVMVADATQSQLNDPVWRNSLFSKWDELISISTESANMPCPVGWEDVRAQFQNVNHEFILAKASMVDGVENQNQTSLNNANTHVHLAGTYLSTAGNLIAAKGY